MNYSRFSVRHAARAFAPSLFLALAGARAADQPPASPPPTPAPPSSPAVPAQPPAPGEAKPAAWNVNAPSYFSAAASVPIDVTEGTWMNIDLSPDGSTIAFDLLGDIYTIPFAGGDAAPLTDSIAWDMQPRFSPDGSRIAFTSDRAGGDNIWVMKKDGSEPSQVTKESFRLLNEPAWAPDGEFIVARKHFTSRRSLGAGEMFLYHRTGGDGLQLTTRPTEQKDVGEPAFSPCGRYLYFSLDATPGSSFEYNKDSNSGIYAINRLDREKGETQTILSGPGGACRPTPSPDGKSLAFVRRDRFKTCLYVLDLDSRRPRMLTDTLDRDMQETWAIHGVYPTMAWTPDSAQIVYWAGGKIRRISVAEPAKITEIPFRVRTARSIAPALRFTQKVHPDTFDVKLLRSVSVSPAGDRVAYQALGKVYIRDLPDGTPRRLTTQDTHFEFFPAFSRDGARIVYTTWNDASLGSVRVRDTASGAETIVTTTPGIYVDPVFTPDGTQVLFGRQSGGFLLSPLHGAEPGLYRAPAAGGPMTLVSRTGTDPQFGPASDRVYLTTIEQQKDNDRRCLISMNLDGAEPRTHYVSENATEFRVSPDGKWLAFAERFNVYVTPMIPTGREVQIGPKSTSQPVAKVTHDAGQWLSWSGDSLRLHWALGPTLYTRPLTDCFAFLAGAPATLPPPTDTGVDISFTCPSDSPRGSLAFTNARVITMRGDEVIDNATVVVERNRITAVGPAAAVKPPPGATVYDCSGKTLMPGIIDVHAHGGMAESGITPQNNWGQHANLAFGVTTIHDPSNDTNAIFAAAELARAGRIVQPRTFSTGTILYGAAGSFKAEIDSLDDALFHLRRMKAVGAFSVKSYNQPRRDQRQQVIEAARQLQMMVVPEGGSLLQHNLTMVVDGHTGVEHCVPSDRLYADALAMWGATRVGYTPTLIVGYGGLNGEFYFYDKENVWENQRLTHFVPRSIVDARSRRRLKSPDEEYNHFRAAKVCKDLIDAGAKVQLGAHGQMAGIGAHWELWMFVHGGMTPLEALRAATLHGAFYLGLDADIGSLEPGKLADLLVLDANPLDDIRNSESVRYTVLNGRVYDAPTMARLGEDLLPAPHYFHHDLDGGVGITLGDSGCAGCGIPGAGCAIPSPDSHDHGPSGYR